MLENLTAKVFLLLVLILGLALIAYGMRDFIRAYKSNSWPSVKGDIFSSYSNEEVVHSDDSDDGTVKYYIKLQYSYSVNNKDYEGSNINLSSNFYTDEAEAKRTLKKYPENLQLDIFFDPDNPGLSVLEPGVHTGWWVGFILGGALFTFLSLIFLWMVSNPK